MRIKYTIENTAYKSKCIDLESKINSKEANRKLSLYFSVTFIISCAMLAFSSKGNVVKGRQLIIVRKAGSK